MKRLTLFISSLALFAVSCSTDEVDNVVVDDVNTEGVVGFFANTTRVGISTIDDIQKSTVGFPVYATTKSNSASWLTNIDGGNNYKYATSTWGWAGVDVKWPTDAGDYPMNFYAYFPDETTLGSGVASVTSTSTSDINLSYVVPVDMDDQIDYLAASATTAARPKGDKLALAFDHILSKVSIQVVPGNGIKVYMPQTGVANVNSTATYEVVGGTWGTATEPKSHDFLGVDEAMMTFEGTDPAELIASPIKTDDFLMLMPQANTATWTHSKGNQPTDAYISALYRMTDTSDKDIVGYGKAQDHPSFYKSATNEQYRDKALYVKIGYPIQKGSFTWEKGLSYVYNLHLGTNGATNGYLLDDYYYDEEGEKVDLKIDGKVPGDPVSDGCIDFTVTVGDWAGDTVYELDGVNL